MSGHPIGPIIFESLVKSKTGKLELDPRGVPAIRQMLAQGAESTSAFHSVIGMLMGNPQADTAVTELCRLLMPMTATAAAQPAAKRATTGWAAKR